MTQAIVSLPPVGAVIPTTSSLGSHSPNDEFEFNPEMGWTFDLDTGLDRDYAADVEYIRKDQPSVMKEVRKFIQDCKVPVVNPPKLKSLAAEVGDDEQLASNSTVYIAANKVYQNRFGMKTSESDTAINPRFGNFAEELVIKPDHPSQAYTSVRQHNNWDNMSWIDIPKLRLALNVQPMRLTHSATKDGKYSMVGSRQAWIPKSNRFKGVYEIFSLFQDINLGSTREPKPAYFPTALGGMGKRIPFGNAENYERFISAYKNGRYEYLYREIVSRTTKFLEKWISGENPEPDDLLDLVSKTESYFTDWVKHHSVYSPTCRLDLPPEVEVGRIYDRGNDPVKDDVAGRLLAEGLLISETQVLAIVEHNELCRALTGSQNINEFKEIRDEARREWSKHTAFSDQMRDIFFKEIIFDRSLWAEPPKEFYIHFERVCKEARGNLKSILRKEPVFDRTVIDKIYERGPMMVHLPNLLLPQLGRSQHYAVAPVVDSAEPSFEAGLDRLLEWLRNPEGPPPRDLINDDNTLIMEAGNTELPAIALVTDDKKLCRQMYIKVRKPVLRITTEWWLRILAFSDTGGREEFEHFFTSSTGLKFERCYLLIDTGSLDTAMSRTSRNASSQIWSAEFDVDKPLNQKDSASGGDDHLTAGVGSYLNGDPSTYIYRGRRAGVLPKRETRKIAR